MKKLLAVLLVGIVAVSTLVLTACPSQQTYAQIWKAAGVFADSYLSIYYPNWSKKAEFDTAWATAYTDIVNWKTGTPCASVVQAVNDAAGLLAQIPVLDSKQTALMAAIVVSVDTVTSFFQQCQLPAAVAAAPKFSSAVQTAAAKLKPPKNANDVKKLWKAAGGPASK